MARGDENIGRNLGGFRIEKFLGRGAMGTVYEGTQLALRRRVAIKVITNDLTDNEDLRRRFWREAKTLAKLDHPGIVSVIHFGSEGDTYYMVMEYVRGQTLWDVIKAEAPLEPKRAARIARQIAEALAQAHSRGVIHRDIKPSNIMLLQNDVVKVLDFGIAKIVGGVTTTLTRTGAQLGTPLYMSPEQWQGAPLSPQSDIYSLGAVLYEMLTGKPPFTGETFAEVVTKVLTQDFPSPAPKNSAVSERLSKIVLDMTARDETMRYVSAEAVARDLKAVESGRKADTQASEGFAISQGQIERLFDELPPFHQVSSREQTSRLETVTGWLEDPPRPVVVPLILLLAVIPQVWKIRSIEFFYVGFASEMVGLQQINLACNFLTHTVSALVALLLITRIGPNLGYGDDTPGALDISTCALGIGVLVLVCDVFQRGIMHPVEPNISIQLSLIALLAFWAISRYVSRRLTLSSSHAIVGLLIFWFVEIFVMQFLVAGLSYLLGS